MLQYLGMVGANTPATDSRTLVTVGKPGFYKVVLTLSRPSYPIHPEAQLTTYETLQGDSWA